MTKLFRALDSSVASSGDTGGIVLVEEGTSECGSGGCSHSGSLLISVKDKRGLSFACAKDMGEPVCLVNGNDQRRIMAVDNTTMDLRSVEFTRGLGEYGSALDVKGSTIMIKLCKFTHNSATTGSRGGAIFVRSGTVELLGTSFQGNVPAALDNEGGSLEVKSICPSGYNGNGKKGGLLAIYGSIGGAKVNNFECTKCSAGRYSELDGDVCTNCAAGYNSSVIAATANTVCEACAEGMFAEEGSASCSICRVGRYSNASGSGSCRACEGGKYLSGEGGDALAHNSGADCATCEKGSYSGEGSSSCTKCGVGTYSGVVGSANCTLCPLGRYGDSEGITSSECSGPCSANFACDAGSTSPSGGCPLGQYLRFGQCRNCPAGRYGDDYSLDSEECSGECLEGWFCPAGSTNRTQTACPEDSYCGRGTTAPESCPTNYAKSCSGEGVGTCEDGTLCLYGGCSGLKGKFNCEIGDYDCTLCASLAAVKIRKLGEVSCPRDSACEKYMQVVMTLTWLSYLGGIDVGIVGLGLVLFGLGTLLKGKADWFGKRAVLYVILPIGIILIVGVELVSYESAIDEIVDFFMAGSCWKNFYGYVKADGLSTGLGLVKIMAFFAFATKLITAWVLRKDVKKGMDGEKEGGGAAFWLLGFSSTFSILNYVQFILGLVNVFEEFGEGVGNSTVIEGAEAFIPCIELEEEYDPVPTKSDKNCLKGEDILPVKVTGNLQMYLACFIGLGVCYGGIRGALELRRRGRGGEGKGKKIAAVVP